MNLLRKGLVVVIILLFIAMNVTSTIINNETISPIIFSDKKFYAVRSNYPSGERLIWFDPDNLEIQYNVGNWPNSLFPGGGTFVKDKWWICDTNGNIFKVNLETGEYDAIGSSGTGELLDLSWDSKTKILWGIDNFAFYSINMEDGTATLGGSPNVSFTSIENDINGNMWGIGYNNGYKLYSIDTSTWNTIVIVNISGQMYDFELAYEKDEEILWCSTINISTFEVNLWIINTDNGLMTFVGNFQNISQLSCFAIPYNWENHRPSAPIITGQICGKVGADYEYTFNSTDDDYFCYYVDWGDNSPIEIVCPFNPYHSGVAKVNHSWYKKGYYIIRAMAKDSYGAVSDWGELRVTMPHPIWWLDYLLDRFPLLQRLMTGLII